MKKILSVGALLLSLNIIVGLLLSAYPIFNVCLNSTIIIVFTLMLLSLYKIKLKDAFKVSLTFVIAFVGLIEYIIGFLSKNELADNYIIITDVVLCTVCVLLIMIANFISSKVDK